MSAPLAAALDEYPSIEIIRRVFGRPDDFMKNDILKQRGDLERLLYLQVDRFRSGAGDARIEMMLLVSNMAELARQSNNLTLMAAAVSLANFLMRVGPAPTGFQMAELSSLLAGISEINHRA